MTGRDSGAWGRDTSRIKARSTGLKLAHLRLEGPRQETRRGPAGQPVQRLAAALRSSIYRSRNCALYREAGVRRGSQPRAGAFPTRGSAGRWLARVASCTESSEVCEDVPLAVSSGANAQSTLLCDEGDAEIWGALGGRFGGPAPRGPFSVVWSPALRSRGVSPPYLVSDCSFQSVTFIHFRWNSLSLFSPRYTWGHCYDFPEMMMQNQPGQGPLRPTPAAPVLVGFIQRPPHTFTQATTRCTCSAPCFSVLTSLCEEQKPFPVTSLPWFLLQC